MSRNRWQKSHDILTKILTFLATLNFNHHQSVTFTENRLWRHSNPLKLFHNFEFFFWNFEILVFKIRCIWLNFGWFKNWFGKYTPGDHRSGHPWLRLFSGSVGIWSCNWSNNNEFACCWIQFLFAYSRLVFQWWKTSTRIYPKDWSSEYDTRPTDKYCQSFRRKQGYSDISYMT